MKLKAVNKGKGISGQEQIAHVAKELAGFEQSTLGELSGLIPPATLAADWKRFLAGAQSLAEDTATLSEAASTNDSATIRRILPAAVATQKQMATIAKRNGIAECERVP